MIIDAHTHIYPDKIAAQTVEMLSGPTGLQPPVNGTADGLKRSMAQHGVDLSIVLPVATNPHKVERLNDFAFALRGQEGLLSLGAMHADCPYWKEELTRVRAEGLRGIKIHPFYNETDFDDIRYLRIFERCAELGLTVVTHAGQDIGFPTQQHCSFEMVLHARREVGDFSLVLAHMGGWEHWDEVETALDDGAVGERLYIDTSFALGTYAYRNDEHRLPIGVEKYGEIGRFLSPERFMRFAEKLSTERILFGSDSPWQAQGDGIAFIRALPLSEEDKAAILGGNAEKLFL